MFKVDFIDGEAITWSLEDGKALAKRRPNYNPIFYVDGTRKMLKKIRPDLSPREQVNATAFENWKPTLSKPETRVLRVDCNSEEDLTSQVNMLKKKYGRTTFRYYNVDFTPQFRYCVQTRTCPTPNGTLSKIHLGLEREQIASQSLAQLRADGSKIGGTSQEVLSNLKQLWKERDPDIVVVSHGQIIELLLNKSEEHGVDLCLGRTSDTEKLSDGAVVSSYGQRKYKKPRYNIPGRIIIDESNSFMLNQTNIAGLWDLARRSYRPLQELAWGSIGRLLTSIEIKKAYLEEDILTPWKNWSGEKPKKASTMHKADRGGFIFSPEPGVHENVYQADFASLFPNIMVERNISPETVSCRCCENEEVPELGYTICEKEEGFIGRVLQPLIQDRQKMKEKLREEKADNPEQIKGGIDAIKWILVSCFGYMGHKHASYGALRCHQAIQAFDRKIMLRTKEIFEQSGYQVVHGIIDSIWVQKARQDAEKFQKVCQKISDEIGIKLEPENKFEWCAFVPRKSSKADIATLNRYFGKTSSGCFKTAGIESEQSSCCEYVKHVQMEMLNKFDRERSAEPVLDLLETRIRRLLSKQVSAEKLVETKKPSKTLEQYETKNRLFSAVKRAHVKGLKVKPGEELSFVVIDDDASPLKRTRLDFEEQYNNYDEEYYRKQLVRAAESVLSPIGFGRKKIERRLSGTEHLSLKSNKFKKREDAG